nr:anti-sigma factor [Afipia sp.]
MTDHNIPVTEDELHAYVDNELPVERRAAVEAWLAAHPDDAERVTSWRAMSDALHAKYDSVADEPVPHSLSVDQLSRTPRRWMMGAIAASLLAFAVGGGIGWAARGANATPSACARVTGGALGAP